jgi:hypothetical protein
VAAKKCFLSFYYKADNWRVAQIKNIGAIEEQPLLSSNKWEEIERKGDDAIKEWVENNIKGKECLVVLVGTYTSGRPWVKYEIKRACEKGIGVLGIYIHNLKDAEGNQAAKGANPFEAITVDGKGITSYAKMYDPPFTTSTYVYEHIKEKISGWVDEAVKLRK